MSANETLARANSVVRSLSSLDIQGGAGPAIFDLAMAFALKHPDLAQAVIDETDRIVARLDDVPTEMIERQSGEVRARLVALIAGELS